MQFSLRTKIVLMCLLIALNLILRYPTSPHEIGMDSFAVHTMANSISEFGYAKWWIHPASIIGWYPYSSVSAVSFVLSGMSQCTSIDIEKVILLYCMILGIFSIFGAYLMAGVIWNNGTFKFLVTTVFSASQGIITFSTWTAHSRTLFVISLPLFIYLLLKTRTFKVRFGILTFVILAMLLVTHHYIYFVIPSIFSYLIVVVVYKTGKRIKSIRIPENIANLAVFAGFLIMFSIPFFTRTLAESDPGGMAGGRYAWMFSMIQSYTRYIGIFIILVVSGYVYLLLKRNKRLEEWFLLFCLIGLAEFLYIITYMKWFILPFASLLIGIALTNVANVKTDTKKRKVVPSLIVVIILLLSLSFTGYYQYLHFLNDPNPNKRYMEDRTYTGGLWIKDNVDKNKRMIASLRLSSISGVPTLTGSSPSDLAYGFVDPNELEVKQIYPATSVEFYFHDPYKVVNHSYTDWYALNILHSDINERMSWAYRSTHRFNLSYYAENKDSSNKLLQSVQQTKDCLYDNGKICIWNLDQGR
jgi:hypothetical protein